jgi:hypothetical protein
MQQESDYLYELDLQYDINKLQQEVDVLDLEPYFKELKEAGHTGWFAGPETWLMAGVPYQSGTEVDIICKQLRDLLGTNEIEVLTFTQEANTSVPAHSDSLPDSILNIGSTTKVKPIKCAVNIQLSYPVGPINFSEYGLITYNCALLNIIKEHGVPVFPTERKFIKFKILDISYKQALLHYRQYKLDNE